MQFLVHAGSTLLEASICLGQLRPDLLVLHSPRTFVPSQILQYQFTANPSEPFLPWESLGLGQFQGEAALGARMLLSPTPGKAGPKAPEREQLHCLGPHREWSPIDCLQHDYVGVVSLQVVPGPLVWELCWG